MSNTAWLDTVVGLVVLKLENEEVVEVQYNKKLRKIETLKQKENWRSIIQWY